MKLFVGLGNPGAKYESNRHNIGFMAVEAIADMHAFPPWRRKFQSLVTEGSIGGERVMLMKPETFMNDSGRAVGEAQRFLKIADSDIAVFHDELDLAPAKVKVKTGGGNAGHNGLPVSYTHLHLPHHPSPHALQRPRNSSVIDRTMKPAFLAHSTRLFSAASLANSVTLPHTSQMANTALPT